MTATAEARALEVVTSSGLRLAVRESGPPEGRAVIGLHGVGGTGASVIAGSLLQRNGLRAITYDARGHGDSDAPADPRAYGYDVLVDDLVSVIEAVGGPDAIVVGASMGGLTALKALLERPLPVAALVLVTPAYDPDAHPVAEHVERASRVADSLRATDLDAFVEAQPVPVDDPRMAALLRGSAQRQFDSHRALSAVADALDTIMVAKPFDTYAQLAAVSIPVLVVGSHDEFDRNHPLRVARAYADALPDTRFTCESPGSIPLAWRGRHLARLALGLAREQGAL